jgi:uncharacterized protein
MTIGSEPKAMQRLTVMLHSRDHSHHHSLAIEILSRARKAHLAGATLMTGMEGLGRSGTVHKHHAFMDDIPLAIVIVDSKEHINEFHNLISPHIGGALTLVEDVIAFRA